MLDNFDFKCAFGAAIISVLIYCLIVTYIVTDGGGRMEYTTWYKSLEFLMLISIFLGYNINNHVFKLCKA